MLKAIVISLVFFLLKIVPGSGQESFTNYPVENNSNKILSGFIRGGLYTSIDKSDNKLYIPSAFSDAGLRIETGNNPNFKAFADIRFRYGTEFLEPVSDFDIREAWVAVNGKKWTLAAGQQIVKWGRCDFTNPTSKLSSQDLVLRSPDREDINIGNLLASADYSPWEKINFEAVVVPYYRASVLIIDPFPLPDYVVINEIKTLQTDKALFSYGLKTDFHFQKLDWSLSWFDGFDPMPGIALTTFNLDLTQPEPVPFIELSEKPYKNKVLGIDFETTAGPLGIRGEAAWSDPELSYETNEYVPLPEVKYVAGIDWATGIWRFTGEYSGKYIIDFKPAEVDPIFGTGNDFSELAAMFAIPGFDPEAYVKQQVGAFNRLYNYQLNEYYHSAGLRVEAEMLYGRFLPSVFTIYNFTSHDLLLIPEIKIKPADGLAVTIGGEIYSGMKDSLFDLVDDFMNSAYVSLRVDF